MWNRLLFIDGSPFTLRSLISGNWTHSQYSPPLVIFITENKIDLVAERVVEESEREEIATQFGGEEWEVSAKTGMNMAELIAEVVEALGKARKSMWKENGIQGGQTLNVWSIMTSIYCGNFNRTFNCPLPVSDRIEMITRCNRRDSQHLNRLPMWSCVSWRD
jgi:predicted GTPase